MAKIVKFDHFWPFWGSNNFRPKNFWWSSKSYGDTNSCKDQNACKRTYVREWICRFFKESKDIWGAKNTQKWLTIFGHFGGQKIFRPKNFWWSSKSYGDTTSCKYIYMYISNGQGCRTGTHGRTYESEFIGSLSDKSGEPKNKQVKLWSTAKQKITRK